MNHVVLLGDSIFDNAAYVARDEPDVIRQLQKRLPDGWNATLRAVDRSVTTGVGRQAMNLPKGASHLVVSAGGNDALGHAGILNESARSAAEVFAKLADAGDAFERDYRLMLEAVLAHRLPTALCTVYYPCFPDPALQRIAVTALTVFNDPIIRTAFLRGLPLLDLRLICNEPGDYANPIEPSAKGGEKIARAISKLIAEHDFARGRTEAFI